MIVRPKLSTTKIVQKTRHDQGTKTDCGNKIGIMTIHNNEAKIGSGTKIDHQKKKIVRQTRHIKGAKLIATQNECNDLENGHDPCKNMS